MAQHAPTASDGGPERLQGVGWRVGLDVPDGTTTRSAAARTRHVARSQRRSRSPAAPRRSGAWQGGRMSSWTAADIPDQTGRTALVTGANSGLVFWSAVELARHGARVLMACRDPRRAEEALVRLRVEVPGAGGAGGAGPRVPGPRPGRRRRRRGPRRPARPPAGQRRGDGDPAPRDGRRLRDAAGDQPPRPPRRSAAAAAAGCVGTPGRQHVQRRPQVREDGLRRS